MSVQLNISITNSISSFLRILLGQSTGLFSRIYYLLLEIEFERPQGPRVALAKMACGIYFEGEISISIKACIRSGWLPEKAIYRKKPERVPSLRIRADGPVTLRMAIIPGDTTSSGKFLMEILSPTTWSKINFDKTTLITKSRFSDMPNPAVLRYPHPEGVKTRLKPNLHNRWR